MSCRNTFSHRDQSQIKEHGLTIEAVSFQIELLIKERSYLKLDRPCTINDGIARLNQERCIDFFELFEKEMPGLRCIKFVPASGAASRMFKSLFAATSADLDIFYDDIADKFRKGSTDLKILLEFMEHIQSFAFFDDLKSIMKHKGSSIENRIQEGSFKEIIHFLLHEEGLNYAQLPKGLLKFHEYADLSRTAFEEHLVEAVSYAKDRYNTCRVHFTVSPEYWDQFASTLETVRASLENKYHVSFDVAFSVQKKSTDTIAVDMENQPFRNLDHSLLFRPGGHGALIENINDLDADIVFLKNIDNVVPDRLKAETFRWKKILGGCLIYLQKQIHGFVKKLISGPVQGEFLKTIMDFSVNQLNLDIPENIFHGTDLEKIEFLKEKLDRPIRVCGMVKNQGEPGGGPFWVLDQKGAISRQIVETAQIDPSFADQQKILKSATHFNPVDLVCGIRNWQGKPFDLHQYVDQGAVFISEKTKDGKALKALEHPGLWNGAMSDWITVFIEVPIITFNPVKTINDLLRPEHQPL